MESSIAILKFLLDQNDRSLFSSEEYSIFINHLDRCQWEKKSDEEKHHYRKLHHQRYLERFPKRTVSPYVSNFIRSYEAMELIYKIILSKYENDFSQISDISTLKCIALIRIEREFMNETTYGSRYHLEPQLFESAFTGLVEVHPDLEGHVKDFIEAYKLMYDNWVENPSNYQLIRKDKP